MPNICIVPAAFKSSASPPCGTGPSVWATLPRTISGSLSNVFRLALPVLQYDTWRWGERLVNKVKLASYSCQGRRSPSRVPSALLELPSIGPPQYGSIQLVALHKHKSKEQETP